MPLAVGWTASSTVFAARPKPPHVSRNAPTFVSLQSFAIHSGFFTEYAARQSISCIFGTRRGGLQPHQLTWVAKLLNLASTTYGEVKTSRASLATLLRGPAAVDREVGAGDLGGVVATEKQRQGCDLLGGDELLGRLRRQQHVVDDLLLGHATRLHGLWNLVLDQRRPDVTRADAVAGDLEGRNLQRHGLGETGDAMLGRHIGRLERRGHQRMRRGGIDDAAPAPLLHAGHGGADAVK